tara:strand:+ start:169 stop:348 length:180 start_codon:yes stop_codon:yes gene_type:complete
MELDLGYERNRFIEELEDMPTFFYKCMNTTCGFIEFLSFAPSATGKCPKCGGITQRGEQ